MPGAICTVTLAGQLAFTGKVTTRQVFVDARRHHIEIQCANNLELETSSVISKTMEYKNNTPEQIIRSVLKPFGINLVVENGQLPQHQNPALLGFARRVGAATLSIRSRATSVSIVKSASATPAT